MQTSNCQGFQASSKYPIRRLAAHIFLSLSFRIDSTINKNSMATLETAPLNPAQTDTDPELHPYCDDARDVDELELPPRRKTKDPLYIRILYCLSVIISIGGFGSAIWGYCIVITAPFDDYSKKTRREGYEKHFYGMQSVVILVIVKSTPTYVQWEVILRVAQLFVNILWSGLNFHQALKGRQLSPSLWLLNPVYDFFLWALLIAFGVLNMVEMLWDRRLCDFLPGGEDGQPDKELYRKCDKAMFRLLVVEMVAVNLGLLVA